MKHVCIPVQSAECNYGESSSNEAAFGFNLVAEFISPKMCTLLVLSWVILSQKV